MSPDYQRLRQQADRLWHRFNDTVDNKDNARGLEQEIRAVVEDFEQNKKPRSIDDRVKRCLEQIHHFKDTGPDTMDFGDLDELHDGFEELREELRDLDNY
jgi:uncharacterized coiled-coil DUF342 family protein